MKTFILFSTLIFSLSTFAAIGCLPGDCCNGHPCGSNPVPSPTPNPRCPGAGGRPHGLVSSSFELSKRAVNNCVECGAEEVCAEYSNNIGEILGHECKTFSR